MTKKKSLKREQLDLNQIIEASIKILADKGLDKLSMRQLAHYLGVSPMAMYRHVKDKDELFNILGEHVLSQLKNIEVSGSWKEKLFQWHNGWRKLMLANPEVGKIWMGRYIPSPTLNWLADQMIIVLEGAGYKDMDCVKLADTLFIYTLGIVNYDLTRSPTAREGHQNFLNPLETPHLVRYLPIMVNRNAEEMYRTGYFAIIEGFEKQLG